MFEQGALTAVLNNNHVAVAVPAHLQDKFDLFRLRLLGGPQAQVQVQVQRNGMPKVVLDQRQRYDQSEMFAHLRADSPIAYVGYGSLTAPQQRREKLMTDLTHRRLEIAFSTVGFSFQLCVSDQSDQQDNTVRLGSSFILDGVCVKFTGELNVLTMEGTGRIEYDQRRAEEENERLLTELQQYRELVASRQHQADEPASAAAVRSGASQHPVPLPLTAASQKVQLQLQLQLQLPGSSQSQSLSNSTAERRKELSNSQ